MNVVKAWLPVVIWAAVILFASGDLFSSSNTATYLKPPLFNTIIRKLGHVVGYAILGFLTWRAAPSWSAVFAIAIAVAVTDELHQASSIARSGSPYDVALDVAGAVIGAVVKKWHVRA